MIAINFKEKRWLEYRYFLLLPLHGWVKGTLYLQYEVFFKFQLTCPVMKWFYFCLHMSPTSRLQVNLLQISVNEICNTSCFYHEMLCSPLQIKTIQALYLKFEDTYSFSTSRNVIVTDHDLEVRESNFLLKWILTWPSVVFLTCSEEVYVYICTESSLLVATHWVE